MVWTAETELVVQPIRPKRIELYDRAGLRCILQMFKFYGFGLHPKPSINIFIFGTGLLSLLVICSYEMIQSIRLLLSHSKIGKDDVCSLIAVSALHIAIVIEYLYVTFSFKTIGRHLDRLIDVITTEILPRTSYKMQYLKKTRVFSVTMRVSVAIVTLIALVVNIYTGEILIRSKAGQLSSMIGFRVLEVVYSVWIIVVVGCCVFCNILPAFLCIFLTGLTDNYLSRGKSMSIAEHQRRHQTISGLLRTLNELYANFLLGSLAFELVLIISYTRGINHATDGSQSVDGLLNTFQIVFLVLKNFCCSTLNEKVQSCLDIPNSKVNGRCSSSDVNFILYLDQQANDKTEITYGGIFPVGKSFIFTVAGTAFSYAMILREL